MSSHSSTRSVRRASGLVQIAISLMMLAATHTEEESKNRGNDGAIATTGGPARSERAEGRWLDTPARFSVFGCLGNHEWLTETEDSITRLFAAQGTRILRGERVAIESAGSKLNLLGVDYQSLAGRMEAPGHEAKEYLSGVERLLIPNTVNILLSHNPNTFDRAAQLGIDLSLSGHTRTAGKWPSSSSIVALRLRAC